MCMLPADGMFAAFDLRNAGRLRGQLCETEYHASPRRQGGRDRESWVKLTHDPISDLIDGRLPPSLPFRPLTEPAPGHAARCGI
jgi:hypothetical protein